MHHRTVLIVGAGIGGLAAGVALQRSGWRVRIFERAVTPRELGFALNLAPNAMAALGELGLADRLIAEGSVIEDVEVRGPEGRVLKRLNVASAIGRVRSVVALRSALHGALLAAVEPNALVLDREAAAVEHTGTGVSLTFTDGRSETGDVLIGADGVGSIVRKCLHPHEPPPRTSGYYAIRGVAHDAGHFLGRLSAVSYFGRGLEASAVRASARAVYWYLSLLSGDVRDGDRDPRAIVERSVASLDDGIQRITHATSPADMRIDELFDREPIGDWGRGRVTLLGDAAHPMLPHTGQGAAQALEDAVAVGLALARNDDVDGSLRRYEHVRAARTRSVVLRGRRIAAFTTTRSRTIGWLRTTALGLVPSRTMASAFLLAEGTDPHRELRDNTR